MRPVPTKLSGAERLLNSMAFIALTFLMLSFAPCDQDCISVEQNSQEQVLTFKMEGTETGKDKISIKDSNGNIIYSKECPLQNERTFYYIDLNTTEISPGTYEVEIKGLNRSTTFSIR